LRPSELSRNILIKIDVQGYEDKVIAGGMKVLKEAKVAIIEISYASMYKNQKLFDDIAGQMRDLGYRYKGSFSEQTYDLESGEPLFTDGIFVNESMK
jgi:hypothetical protein